LNGRASESSRVGPADVIVAAAGVSQRMGGIDKMMVPIGGRPMLAWTLEALAASPVVARIIVVTSGDNIDGIAAASWLPERITQIVAGGDRRQQSVARGLDSLRSPTRGHPADDRLDRVVLVHDGARPAISAGLIEADTRAAEIHGAAIPVLPVVETVKRMEGELVGETVDRSTLVTAQTPQAVRTSLLLKAYDQFPPDGPRTFTDEAALLEACRIPVHAIPGETMNLKVTTPDDVGRAELALLGRVAPRVGFGEDAHPFGPGDPLALGGITVEGAPRLHGHSDGDVVLHAVADALLGAAGLGDLGRVFPAGPATPRGVASGVLLGDVVRRLAAVGLRPARLDLTVVAARPRLADRLDAMRAAIAGLVELPIERVNVKASTGNLAGPEGAGRGIAARVVAVVEPIR
jgi:2-C-methyl-D-erythritol 4-phosphate cytidylyltransferase/2-C-methyl-D-erythritol 2,4-cyclodiphosphate synthase